jgi:acyl carrier protein
MNDTIESRLSLIWCSTLSIAHVQAEDHFYEAGGDSMGVITLVARVSEELDLEFDYRPFLESPTFGTLCAGVHAALLVQSPTAPACQHESAHQRAVSKAERASCELLSFRPFKDNAAKPTLTLAVALSESATELSPELNDQLALMKVLKRILS